MQKTMGGQEGKGKLGKVKIEACWSAVQPAAAGCPLAAGPAHVALLADRAILASG